MAMDPAAGISESLRIAEIKNLIADNSDDAD